MNTTVLSSKGQIIIPKSVRSALRWGPGMRLSVQDTPEGVLLKPLVRAEKAELAPGLAAIRSRVGHRGAALSLAQMDAAVLREAGASAPKTPTRRAR